MNLKEKLKYLGVYDEFKTEYKNHKMATLVICKEYIKRESSLKGVFVFSETEKGYNFWDEINNKIEGLNSKTDNVVEQVKRDFDVRSAIGIKKYKTTLEDNNKDDFLQHLQEELMDAVLYIKKLQLNKNK